MAREKQEINAYRVQHRNHLLWMSTQIKGSQCFYPDKVSQKSKKETLPQGGGGKLEAESPAGVGTYLRGHCQIVSQALVPDLKLTGCMWICILAHTFKTHVFQPLVKLVLFSDSDFPFLCLLTKFSESRPCLFPFQKHPLCLLSSNRWDNMPCLAG